MRWKGGSVEETLDIDFGSTGDDDLEPRSLCSCIGQDLQDAWTAPVVPTFVERIDNKDKTTLGGARQFADEVKEKGVLHRLRCQVWVVAKRLCHDAPKGGEDYGKFVNEGRKDISGLAQIRVVPPAEKRSTKLLPIMKVCTDRMSQRCFADSGRAIEPKSIPLMWVGHPGNESIKDGLAGALHTTPIQVIAGVARFEPLEPLEQKSLLYMKPVRMESCRVETMRAHQFLWLGGAPQHSLHGRSLQ